MLVLAWKEADLTPAERLVLLALADSADREGRNAFPGAPTIAEHCQIDLRSVRRCLADLKARQIIAVQEPARHHRPTTYRLFPRRANLALLENSSGVTSGVTNPPNPPTPPYKEDPGDPVGEATLRLLERTATQFLRHQITGEELVTRLRRWSGGRISETTLRLIARKVESA